eukprot:COSAG01_NODE_39246_length_479_cov_0.802632_1_plen_35_part_10
MMLRSSARVLCCAAVIGDSAISSERGLVLVENYID